MYCGTAGERAGEEFGMVTINDVAKLAGVSAATVSRVANGNYRMETEKYRRVVDAMEQLSYFPRGRIRLQNSETTHDTGVELKVLVIAWSATQSSTYVLPELERAARMQSMSLTYKLVMDNEGKNAIMNGVSEYDGVVLCDYDIQYEDYQMLSRVVPVVSCRKQFKYSGVISVSIDDELAGYDATAYLLRCGRRKVKFIGSTFSPFENTDNAKADALRQLHQAKRYAGYIRACIEMGVQPMSMGVVSPDQNADDTERRLEDIMGADVPDGVVCQYFSDLWKIRSAAEQIGLSVPGDIAPVVFSDVDGSDSRVTVVSQRLDLLADTTMRVLRLIIDGSIPRESQISVVTPHRLIMR